MQSYFLHNPTRPVSFFWSTKCTLYSSLIAAAVELSLSENKLWFFSLIRTFFCFRRKCTFSPLISKGSRGVSTLHYFFFLSPQLCGDAASLPQTGSVLAHSTVSLLLSRSIAPHNPLSYSIRSSCSYRFHHTLISSVTGGGLTRRAGY